MCKVDITDINPDKLFFTSDTHFNHTNILKYCYRPFETIEDHDETIIRNWNSVVPEDGVVFHLGDFGCGSVRYLKSVLERLNGTIFLCVGNHDFTKTRDPLRKFFAEQRLQYNLYVKKQHIILNHRPFLCYEGSNINTVWNLFGHVHSGPNANGIDIPRLTMLFPTQYDVGVDNNNYTPISFYQVKEKIEEQIKNVNK